MIRALPPARWGLFLLLLSTACAGPPVWRPPRFGSQPPPPAPEARLDPAGPVLVVRPVADARPPHHRDGLSSWLEEQGGYTGEARTRDAGWVRPVPRLVTEALAERLRAEGRFSEVRVDEGAAPLGALVLTARLRRFLGWQAYRVEPEAASEPRILESLGDVFLDEVEVQGSGGRLLFVGQAGASLHEASALDPYALAREALAATVTSLGGDLASAPLEAPLARTVHVVGKGDLSSLLEALPGAWTGRSRANGTPHGWTGAPSCTHLALKDPSRTFFHPNLGRYHPALDLWACPAGWSGRMRLGGADGERYPAEVLGVAPGGAAVLVHTLGATSWPSAPSELRAWLGLAEVPGLLRLPPEP